MEKDNKLKYTVTSRWMTESVILPNQAIFCSKFSVSQLPYKTLMTKKSRVIAGFTWPQSYTFAMSKYTAFLTHQVL